jgi:hypothetical protein
MEFQVATNGASQFLKIHPLIADLIRAVPDTADPSGLSQTAEARLYPDPAASETLSSLRADWKAFVQPGLHAHFQSGRDLVAADIKRMRQDDDLYSLTIPRSHADAWLNALNQARLILAADLGFDESVLDRPDPPDILTEHGMAVFRVDLYAFMQQCLIEQIE